MNGLRFFDCNLRLGRANAPAEFGPGSTEDILTLMDRCGIAEAMASGFEALEYHPLEGNRVLSAICAEQPRFQPVWTLLPGHTGEFPAGAALGEALRDGGVRMARLYPSAGKHNFSLERWCAGELLDLLSERRLPVLLDAGELSWEALHAFLEENPALPVVLTNLTYRMDRVVYPLLERHKNLYLETSGLKGFLSLEDLCRRFGSGRLLFGTGLPAGGAGAAAAVVECSDISREEKEGIARGNLEALLAAVRN